MEEKTPNPARKVRNRSRNRIKACPEPAGKSHFVPRKAPETPESARFLPETVHFSPVSGAPSRERPWVADGGVALRPPSSVPFGYPRLLAGYAPPGVQRPGERPKRCGLCTPGILMTLTADLRHNPPPAQQQVRDMLAGNLCRCTGYQGMVDAVPALVESGRLDAPPAEAAR